MEVLGRDGDDITERACSEDHKGRVQKSIIKTPINKMSIHYSSYVDESSESVLILSS